MSHDTFCTKFPTCPYCGEDDEDYGVYDKDGRYTCDHCGKEYQLHIETVVNFTSVKLPVEGEIHLLSTEEGLIPVPFKSMGVPEKRPSPVHDFDRQNERFQKMKVSSYAKDRLMNLVKTDLR